MPTTREDFVSLPTAVLSAVESHIGPLVQVEEHDSGMNSQISARLVTAERSVFVKGLRMDHKQAWTQQREAEINAHLTGVAPRLLWRVQEDGWDLLGFEAVDGKHADYSPGSPDLPRVVELLARLSVVTSPQIELRDAAQRLAGYVDDPADLDHFRGEALLHTDWNHANILITDTGDTRMVDWGWATRGAPWLDTAYWTIWLIACGHTPAEAEALAAMTPKWSSATGQGLTAFATVNARIWTEIAGADSAPWVRGLSEASTRWLGHRGTRRRT